MVKGENEVSSVLIMILRPPCCETLNMSINYLGLGLGLKKKIYASESLKSELFIWVFLLMCDSAKSYLDVFMHGQS